MRPNTDPMVSNPGKSTLPSLGLDELEDTLREGDIIFTRIPGRPFRRVAEVTGTWTNHVGIIVGFDGMLSHRQFCSRFVREVLQESMGIAVGEVMTFRDLLERNPETDQRLWKLWYFGRIPWERATITPESLYASPALTVVFDGELRRGRPHGATCGRRR